MAVFAFGGCTAPNAPETTQSESDPADAVISACQEALTDQLKDPHSAQFEDVQAFEGVGWLVTGKMNAKNAMGGYVGFAPFRCEASKDATTGEVDGISVTWEGR